MNKLIIFVRCMLESIIGMIILSYVFVILRWYIDWNIDLRDFNMSLWYQSSREGILFIGIFCGVVNTVIKALKPKQSAWVSIAEFMRIPP